MKTHRAWLGLALGLVLGSASWALASDEAAKDFSLSDLNGKTFKLSEVLGKKTVVLNFWAAWCTTCKEEIPQLSDLEKSARPGEAVFIGINAGDQAPKAKKFQERNTYPYAVVLDLDKSVAKLYGVTGVPQTIIINKKGTIVFRGSRPPKELPR